MQPGTIGTSPTHPIRSLLDLPAVGKLARRYSIAGTIAPASLRAVMQLVSIKLSDRIGVRILLGHKRFDLLNLFGCRWRGVDPSHSLHRNLFHDHLAAGALTWFDDCFDDRFPARVEMVDGIVHQLCPIVVDAAATTGFVEHLMDLFPWLSH